MLTNRVINIIALITLAALLVVHYFSGIWCGWYIVIVLLFTALKIFGSTHLSANFFIHSKCKGTAGIAITFDDGPIPEKTERILSILEKHQTKATFFCIGSRVIAHPQLVEKIHKQGHLIGNHSFLHGKGFDLQPTSLMRQEIQLTDAAIEKIVGIRPRFFRPPFGVMNPALANAITTTRHITVGWSVRSFDTLIKKEEKLFNRVIKNIKAGDIILFHDYSETTIAILPRVIKHIKEIGLKIVSLEELLSENAYV